MKSMTGYGAAAGRAADVHITVEIRSVNQRFLDTKINMPREYSRWESDLRAAVSEVVGRGRVEVYISRGASAVARSVVLQEEVAEAYLKAARKLKKRFNLPGEIEIGALLDRNDVLRPVEHAIDGSGEIDAVKKLLARALKAHSREREREGAHLKRDMLAQARVLVSLVGHLGTRAEGQRQRLHERLERKLGELLGKAGIEPARLAQEAAILAERADITEEIVRLGSHVQSLGELLALKEPVAKRVDFLIQELTRELNTIGSKAGDLEITNMVLEGKATVEKLREQIQNVE